jgi:hypothetical protein
MITIKAGELTGMLTDALRTVGKDASLPMFHAVHLYSSARDGKTALVAESTDRFIAGQAWDEADGELSPIVLAVPDVKALLTQVKAQTKWMPVDMLVEDRLVVKVGGLRAEYSLSHATFPEFSRIDAQCTPAGELDGISFSDEVMAPLATIAKRRKSCLQFGFASTRTRGTRVHIGDRYMAVAMPVRTEPIEWAGLFTPPAKVKAVA